MVLLIGLAVGMVVLIGLFSLNKFPIADFDYLAGAEGAKICAGMRVTFYNQSRDPEGGELSYRWDFGDGETSLEERPFHVFQEPRDYLVTLVVRDQAGAEDSKTKTIRVQPTGPVASFEATPLNPLVNNPVTFMDRSYHPAGFPIAKTTWIFSLAEREETVSHRGCGFQEQHVYSRPGTYKVELIVEDDQGLKNSCIREIVVSDLSTSIVNLNQSIEGLDSQIQKLGVVLERVTGKMGQLDADVRTVISARRYNLGIILQWVGIAIAISLGLYATRRKRKR